MKAMASTEEILLDLIRKAVTRVTLLETPAIQWTSTLVFCDYYFKN